MYLVGKMFIDGRGGKRDEKKGMAWIRQAALRGNTKAIVVLEKKAEALEALDKDRQKGQQTQPQKVPAKP